MSTNPTLLDGLLEDDVPEALTARAQADAQQQDADGVAPVAPADPGDGDLQVGVAAAQVEESAAPVTPDATEKLVIVEGQTFVVDAGIDNETIREHLIRQGFANLAGAEIRTGTRQHNGKTLSTVDFIKRAGTKG